MTNKQNIFSLFDSGKTKKQILEKVITLFQTKQITLYERDSNNDTILSLAAHRGYIELFQYILNNIKYIEHEEYGKIIYMLSDMKKNTKEKKEEHEKYSYIEKLLNENTEERNDPVSGMCITVTNSSCT